MRWCASTALRCVLCLQTVCLPASGAAARPAESCGFARVLEGRATARLPTHKDESRALRWFAVVMLCGSAGTPAAHGAADLRWSSGQMRQNNVDRNPAAEHFSKALSSLSGRLPEMDCGHWGMPPPSAWRPVLDAPIRVASQVHTVCGPPSLLLYVPDMRTPSSLEASLKQMPVHRRTASALDVHV